MFSQLSESEQFDEIVTKYIFLRNRSCDGFHQFSLINEVNPDLIVEQIPRINYDLVETYWRKKYKTKQRPESTRPLTTS